MIYGFDIGGSKIELVVFDGDFTPVERSRVATPTQDYTAFLDAIVGQVVAADEKFGAGHPIGLGMPGLVDHLGRSFCANVPAATGKHVAADLSERLGRTITSENDCRLFALSEAHGGAGDGYRTVYGAILGTGAAGGLVIDGQLERGRQGIAGEYGHIQLPAAIQQHYGLPLLRCGCGLPACIESYIGGGGILTLAQHFHFTADTPASLAQAWAQGTPEALRTRDCFFDILGAGFATILMMHDPDVIVMGGGVSLLPNLAEDLHKAVSKHLFSGFTVPPIVPARFGDSSGVRGAAMLAQRSAR